MHSFGHDAVRLQPDTGCTYSAGHSRPLLRTFTVLPLPQQHFKHVQMEQGQVLLSVPACSSGIVEMSHLRSTDHAAGTSGCGKTRVAKLNARTNHLATSLLIASHRTCPPTCCTARLTAGQQSVHGLLGVGSMLAVHLQAAVAEIERIQRRGYPVPAN